MRFLVDLPCKRGLFSTRRYLREFNAPVNRTGLDMFTIRENWSGDGDPRKRSTLEPLSSNQIFRLMYGRSEANSRAYPGTRVQSDATRQMSPYVGWQ